MSNLNNRLAKLEQLTGIKDEEIAERLTAWWEGLGDEATMQQTLTATDYRIIELLQTAEARRFLATQKPSDILTRVVALIDGQTISEEIEQQLEALRREVA